MNATNKIKEPGRGAGSDVVGWIGFLPEVNPSRIAAEVYRAEERVKAARQALADAEASLKTAIATMEARIAIDWTAEEIAEARRDFAAWAAQ